MGIIRTGAFVTIFLAIFTLTIQPITLSDEMIGAIRHFLDTVTMFEGIVPVVVALQVLHAILWIEITFMLIRLLVWLWSFGTTGAPAEDLDPAKE